MGFVRSGYGRVHAFFVALTWLPRALRLTVAVAGFVAVVQVFWAWGQVRFAAPHAGEHYDWQGEMFTESWLIAGLGLVLLLLAWRASWRKRDNYVLAAGVGGFILYQGIPTFSRLNGTFEGWNLSIAAKDGPLMDGSGYGLGLGLYAVLIAGTLAVLAGVVGFLATERAIPDPTGEPIFHLVEEADFRAACGGHVYRPASLARDGFVHCSLEASVIAVANDYYARPNSPVLLLQIDPESLEAETKYEFPDPPPGARLTTHLATSPIFPHVYGPIDYAAIEGVGVMGRTAEGFTWPEEFFPLDVILG